MTVSQLLKRMAHKIGKQRTFKDENSHEREFMKKNTCLNFHIYIYIYTVYVYIYSIYIYIFFSVLLTGP